MNLLLAGLEAVDGATQSPACQCVANLAALDCGEHKVESLNLPARWDDCFNPLEAMLDLNWDAIVIVSEKVCESIAIERIAINETDVSQKDAIGRRPRGKVIEVEGDPGYWTTLPYRELASKLTAQKFMAVPSHSAGMALANFACYRLMHGLTRRNKSSKAGLLQLPFSGKAFDESEAKRFLAVLLETLDPSSIAQDSLEIDLQRVSSRLRSEQPLR